jgi:hypothetical protein
MESVNILGGCHAGAKNRNSPWRGPLFAPRQQGKDINPSQIQRGRGKEDKQDNA